MTTPPPERLVLSAIVRDSAETLERMLSSARPFCDGIYLVDTGSTDDTIARAQDLGARVAVQPWADDFSRARNLSLDMAADVGARWALILDSDEELVLEAPERLRARYSRELRGCIRRRERWPDQAQLLQVVDVDSSRPPSAWSRYPQARIVPIHPRIRYRNRVHNQLYDLSTGEPLSYFDVLPGLSIWHTGYQAGPLRTKAAYRRRLMLLELAEDPDRGLLRFYLARSYAYARDWARAEEHAAAAELLAQRESPLTRGLYIAPLRQLRENIARAQEST